MLNGLAFSGSTRPGLTLQTRNSINFEFFVFLQKLARLAHTDDKNTQKVKNVLLTWVLGLGAPRCDRVEIEGVG